MNAFIELREVTSIASYSDPPKYKVITGSLLFGSLQRSCCSSQWFKLHTWPLCYLALPAVFGGNSIHSSTEKPIPYLSLHAHNVYNGIICMDAHVQYMLNIRICSSSTTPVSQAKVLAYIMGPVYREQYILLIPCPEHQFESREVVSGLSHCNRFKG